MSATAEELYLVRMSSFLSRCPACCGSTGQKQKRSSFEQLLLGRTYQALCACMDAAAAGQDDDLSWRYGLTSGSHSPRYSMADTIRLSSTSCISCHQCCLRVGACLMTRLEASLACAWA